MSKQGYNYIRKTFTVDGVRYEVSGSTEEEAITKKLEKIRELQENRIDSNMSVRHWSKVWLETYVQPRGLTAASYRAYTDKLDNIILPAIGKYKIKDINPTQLQRLLNTRTGFSFSDTSKLRMVLKAMFRQAWHDRLISYDPADGLQMPKTTRGKHRSLTEEERAALLSVCNAPKLGYVMNNSGMWIKCMLYCGLRPGETAALRWSDLDLAAGNLTVHAAKEAGSKALKGPKTEAGNRTIPIPDVYLQDLRKWPKKHAPRDFVFTQRDGSTPLTDTSMRRMWEAVKKYWDIALGAKIETIKPDGARKPSHIVTHHALADDIDLYCLRHTYCTDLEKHGVPINIAKVLMGHEDISVTANIYTHHDSSTIEAARALINAK